MSKRSLSRILVLIRRPTKCVKLVTLFQYVEQYPYPHCKFTWLNVITTFMCYPKCVQINDSNTVYEIYAFKTILSKKAVSTLFTSEQILDLTFQSSIGLLFIDSPPPPPLRALSRPPCPLPINNESSLKYLIWRVSLEMFTVPSLWLDGCTHIFTDQISGCIFLDILDNYVKLYVVSYVGSFNIMISIT